jgi:hypothetical protein
MKTQMDNTVVHQVNWNNTKRDVLVDNFVIDDMVDNNNAWFLSKSDEKGKHYARTQYVENGKTTIVLLHRYLYEKYIGKIGDGKIIDHKNGDTLDNRLDNLRLVSYGQNSCNKRCTSKYVGVMYINKHDRWRAIIPTFLRKDKTRYIGQYKSEMEAAVQIAKRCGLDELLIRPIYS